MGEVWTHGKWVVKPGREDDFIRAWSALGDWTIATYPGAAGRLLRDPEQPNVFISFGPWPDRTAAAEWRSSEGFREAFGVIEETLQSFEPGLFDLVMAKGFAQEGSHGAG